MDAFGAGDDMKILFTSDVHEDMSAFKRFTLLLKSNDYDIGVIAGDLMEYDLTLDEMQATPGIEKDDLLEELYDPDDTIDDLNRRVTEFRKSKDTPLYKTVQYKERELRSVLRKSEKPVVLIPGNHDLAEWHSDNIIHNVHNKAFSYHEFTFIGFKYTSLDINENLESRYIKRVERRITQNTILVTHAPPYGVLDVNYRNNHLGSKAIARLNANSNVVLHLFGHIHDSFGFKGKSANGSFVKGRKFIAIDTKDFSFRFVE